MARVSDLDNFNSIHCESLTGMDRITFKSRRSNVTSLMKSPYIMVYCLHKIQTICLSSTVFKLQWHCIFVTLGLTLKYYPGSNVASSMESPTMLSYLHPLQIICISSTVLKDIRHFLENLWQGHLFTECFQNLII